MKQLKTITIASWAGCFALIFGTRFSLKKLLCGQSLFCYLRGNLVRPVCGHFYILVQKAIFQSLAASRNDTPALYRENNRHSYYIHCSVFRGLNHEKRICIVRIRDKLQNPYYRRALNARYLLQNRHLDIPSQYKS
jgi:hypothetical protein